PEVAWSYRRVLRACIAPAGRSRSRLALLWGASGPWQARSRRLWQDHRVRVAEATRQGLYRDRAGLLQSHAARHYPRPCGAQHGDPLRWLAWLRWTGRDWF